MKKKFKKYLKLSAVDGAIQLAKDFKANKVSEKELEEIADAIIEELEIFIVKMETKK